MNFKKPPAATHAILPPSSADRWMVCLGWLKATGGKSTAATKFAQDGSDAHDLLETAIKFEIDPNELSPNAEHVEAVGHAIDWLRSYITRNAGTQYHSEAWIRWGEAIGYKVLGGTSDLVAYNAFELAVVDYKHGAGVLVEPDSPQLFCYMLGLRHMVGQRKHYRNVIVQPRGRHINGPVREHLYTNTELDRFAEEVRNAVKINFAGTASRTAGEHCRWCYAAPSCRTLAEKALAVAVDEFDAADIARLLE